MKGAPANEAPEPGMNMGTMLAFKRTYLALERTQMAWVRTALSLISFGFTIGKFFEFLREKQGEQATLLGSSTVGIIMIAIGLIGLALATAQHLRDLAMLRKEFRDMPLSLSTVMSGLIAVLGIVALIGATLR